MRFYEAFTGAEESGDMMALRRVAAVLMLAALCCVWGASPASAHTRVVWSYPAQGASLPYPPAQVAIRTSEPVDLGLSQIVVRDADGRAQTLSDTALTEGASVLVAAVDDKGAWGQWTVDYRIVGADGHPVTGRIDFAVGEAARTTTESQAATTRWLMLGGGAVALLAGAWYLRWSTSRLSRAEARRPARTS
ncbi:MAG TPA: copper resistance CopC family protein [Nocardioides sp.]|nr:copper resistance CopC family protein [Nocardioides sp.]